VRPVGHVAQVGGAQVGCEQQLGALAVGPVVSPPDAIAPCNRVSPPVQGPGVIGPVSHMQVMARAAVGHRPRPGARFTRSVAAA